MSNILFLSFSRDLPETFEDEVDSLAALERKQRSYPNGK